MVAEGGKGQARSEIPALERYKKEKLLGEGGMGQVWLAYDRQLERQVALKMVSGGQAVDTLRREVHGCLELTHPHIIRIYDLVILPGEDPFISMEYIEGEDLTHKVKQKPGERFSWQELEPYILSLCDGLAYAHDQGMVHRDIKPQNLMITKENELKLADFGIAAPLQEEDEESATQVPRAGTPIYWSPQQAQGMNPTPTDDIYALGVTLFQLLVGQPPFKGANEPALTYQHINEEPPHPLEQLKELGGEGKIPGYVSELILKCLAKKPTERFQGAGDVQAWIKAKGDPVVKRQKRMALVSGVMGVVALAMGALAIWAFNQRTEAEEQRGIAQTKQEQAETAREGETKERKKAETELKKAQAVSEFMGGIFSAVKPGELENASDEDKDLLKLVLSKGAERIKDLEGQPEVEASIRSILGEAYYSLAFYDEAFVHHERALALRLELFGPDHPDVAGSYNNIGGVYHKKAEYDKALEYYRKSLAILLKQLGPDHPHVAASYNNIGLVYNKKGEYDKALEYYQKSLAIKLKQLGADHPKVALSYHNIGGVHNNKGEYDKALEYYQKSLAIYLKQLGPDHSDVGGRYNNMAYSLDALGKVKEARDRMEKALAIYQKALGDEHQDTINAKNALETLKRGESIMVGEFLVLGSIEHGKKQYARAMEFFQRALKLAEVRVGKDHIQVAYSYDWIGLAHYNSSEYDQALEFYQKAHSIYLKKLGPDHQDTKNAKVWLDRIAKEMKATPNTPAPPKK
jgi:tetratricopeptide (TPR) repeat protein/predicted Ser/Thr protein kinase